MRPSFFHHLHPPTIPAKQARWRYTLGAGGTAVFLALVVAGTGLLEVFYYVPTPAQAALSVQTISYLVPFGGLVRNVHYWSAQLLVLVMGVHLVRVVFTGAYAPPRRFNHLLGLALLVVAILLDFTGYVLRWDQGIQWALVVGTNLISTIPVVGPTIHIVVAGGAELGSGEAALLRFYGWHIFGLTLLFGILSAWHLFRVRRDGGIAVPPPSLRTDHQRLSRNELVRREVLAMMLTAAALLILAVVRPAPIAAPMVSLDASTAEASAPWFFLWVQQILKWGDPFLLGVIVPGMVLAVLALMPYLLPGARPRELGRWFPSSNRAAQILLALILAGITTLTLMALLGNR
jgi:quinol-cytochrome oxidoreductase complex cytochrome b subunit